MINKESILREIPLFAALCPKEIALIKERSSILEYKKDEIIYKEGSEPSSLYCLISGRALIYTKDAHGKQNILEYLHRGKYFGIISILTGDPHSVTTRAINDCQVLAIAKKDFDFILKKIPQLAIDLSQTLSRRLKRKDIHQKTVFESTIISVSSFYPHSGKSIYALNLALSLKQETHKSVIILDLCRKDQSPTLPERLDIGDNYQLFDLCCSDISTESIERTIVRDKFGIDLLFLAFNPKEGNCFKKVVDILSIVVNDYHYIVLDLPSRTDPSIVSILNQSDLIHVLTSPQAQDLKKTRRLIERLERKFNFLRAKIKVIINEYKPSQLNSEERAQVIGHAVFADLPQIEDGPSSDRLVLDNPESKYSKAIRTIARHEGDCLVGLVLGVGAAYGFCHIGVLKVLEEEGVPIDIICGSSMGALIAALWTTGNSSEKIIEMTEELRDSGLVWNLMDFTFPLMGFLKGDKLNKFLKKYIGNKTFYDTSIPLKIIASDVKKKETKVFDKGFLLDALMASCSMPGVFRPFKFKEDMLFDGGVMHPLPTEPLFEMGVKKIIAVNVTPSKEDIAKQYENIKKDVANMAEGLKKGRGIFNLRRYLADKFRNNILDIIFSSIEAMQSGIEKREEQLADIVLHPDTIGMHWMEFNRAGEFALKGEEEARKNIKKIKEIINE